MTDREKLIALLEDAEYQCDNRDCEEDAKGCEYLCYHNCWAQFFADHLLANGVVVREWIPVTERLPEDGDFCICFDGSMAAVLRWDERAEKWADYRRSYPKSSVTHWMPLPEPPMRKGENDG